MASVGLITADYGIAYLEGKFLGGLACDNALTTSVTHEAKLPTFSGNDLVTARGLTKSATRAGACLMGRIVTSFRDRAFILPASRMVRGREEIGTRAYGINRKYLDIVAVGRPNGLRRVHG